MYAFTRQKVLRFKKNHQWNCKYQNWKWGAHCPEKKESTYVNHLPYGMRSSLLPVLKRRANIFNVPPTLEFTLYVSPYFWSENMMFICQKSEPMDNQRNCILKSSEMILGLLCKLSLFCHDNTEIGNIWNSPYLFYSKQKIFFWIIICMSYFPLAT